MYTCMFELLLLLLLVIMMMEEEEGDNNKLMDYDEASTLIYSHLPTCIDEVGSPQCVGTHYQVRLDVLHGFLRGQTIAYRQDKTTPLSSFIHYHH